MVMQPGMVSSPGTVSEIIGFEGIGSVLGYAFGGAQ